MDDVWPDLVEQATMVGVPRGDAEPLGGGLSQCRRQIANTHDLDFRQFAEAAQVLAGDLARADQSGLDHRWLSVGVRGIREVQSPSEAPVDDPGGHSYGDRAGGNVAEHHAERADLRSPADPHAAENLRVGP